MEAKYKVVSEDNHNIVWATGFYGKQGKALAQKKIDEGYFHKYMSDEDINKGLTVIPE